MVVDVTVSLAALLLGLARDARRIPALAPASSAAEPFDYLLHPSPSVIVGAHVLGAILLLGRRRWPLAVTVVLCAVSVVVPVISTALAGYAVARYGGSVRQAVLANALVVVSTLTGADLWQLVGETDWRRGDPYSTVLVACALASLGLYLRTRSDLLVAMAERLEHAEDEAEIRAEAAGMRQRAQLAVRLHDEVSRDLTTMTMAATALGVTTGDDETRSEAERMQGLGRRALATLHQMIQALTRETGDRIDTCETGEAIGQAPDRAAARRMPVDAAARAVLDEALHNADKHAPGCDLHATLHRDADVASVEVASSGGAAAGAAGSGRGLASLRERCETLGGTLTAGPESEGRWRVAARLPRAGQEAS